MQLDLRMQGVAEEAIAGVVEGDTGLVAGGLDSEDQHGEMGADQASDRGKTLILCVVYRHHYPTAQCLLSESRKTSRSTSLFAASSERWRRPASSPSFAPAS